MRPARLLLALLAPTALGAQVAPTPPALSRVEAGSCPRCTLKLEYVATVGARTDKELLTDQSNLLALPGGGFVAWGGGLMSHYDAYGKFVRTVGTLGEGPGEYRGANAVTVARGDSVVLYSYGRMTTISLASGKGRTARSPRQQAAFRILSLRDGGLLAQNYSGAPGAFIVMDPDGRVRATFGPIGDTVRFRTGQKGVNFDAQQFAIAASPSGGFWAARMNYKASLQRFSETGKVLQTITHQPAWFTPYSYEAQTAASSQGMSGARPLPRVLGIWAEARDQVYVVATVADAHWAPASAAGAPPASGREGSRAMSEPVGGYRRYLDAIIDVYDGKSGRLLGSWRTDEWPLMPIGEGLLAMRNQSEDGVLSMPIWRMVLNGR